MKELENNKAGMPGESRPERAALVGLRCTALADFDHSDEDTMEELSQLLETAGGECIFKAMQNRPTPDPRTFIGEGKAQEIAQLVKANDVELLVMDNELSPSQARALEDIMGCRVMDRSGLILDIFAQRAQTREGKLQVELAQYQYLLPRLSGMWTHLVRQTAGGGRSPIGTRGPGETQLETDRRHIRQRIARLQREIENVRQIRSTQRRQREKREVPLVALVGYTNAGKSTLLNHLTGAGVLEEDKLFATLDPTTRVLELPGRQEILLTDTVGFIRKLPHHLIEAFKSTLEEAKYADYIVHVVDASNPQRDKQMHIVYDTLYQLDIREKTVITLFNKQDQVTDEEPIRDFKADYTLAVSAKKGTGLEELKELFCTLLRDNKILVERTISYQEAGILQQIRKSGELLEEEYRPEGIFIRAYVTPEIYGSL